MLLTQDPVSEVSAGPRPSAARDARSVIDLLRARVARGSRPPHDDGASIALAVEGGAMRGVISAGMVWALEDLGYTLAFDAIYGSSAGAINAAYFLAGQAGLGTTIYFEDINNRTFIDLSRPLRGRPIVDLGFLLDDVARHRKHLDTGRIIDAGTPLSVLATDVDSRSSVAFRDFDTTEQLFGALRAGATMPVIAGGPFKYRWPPAARCLPQRADSPAGGGGGQAHARHHAVDARWIDEPTAIGLRPILRRATIAPHFS